MISRVWTIARALLESILSLRVNRSHTISTIEMQTDYRVGIRWALHSEKNHTLLMGILETSVNVQGFGLLYRRIDLVVPR